MYRINSFFERYIEKIIMLFLFIQPLLDFVAAISINVFNVSLTISSVVRFLFLLFCIYYLIFLSKTNNKKRNLFILGSFIIYLILFVFTIVFYKSFDVFGYEVKNLFNTFYLPIVLVSLLDIFEQYNLKIKLKSIICVYFIYIILILIPNITHTGFSSYDHSKFGEIGWFLSANSIGNILSIMLPFVFLYLIKADLNMFFKACIIIITLYVFFSMGTKVPIFSFYLCFIINFLFYVIKCIKCKEYKYVAFSFCSAFVVVILAIIIIPKTTFYKNIQIHKNYLGFNSYTEMFTNYDLLDHFVFSQRLTFLKNTSVSYNKASLMEKVFGIGYIENYGTDKVSIKTIEIDYFEILYRNGIIGFVLYFSIILPVIIKKARMRVTSLESLEFKLSIMLILLLSLFSGHVLVNPSVGIFVVFTLLKGGFYEEIN